MERYKYFKIKVIKDWEGEDWDVYDERQSLSDLMIYRGWPYSLTPKDGIGGQFSYILTPEIAIFIKSHSITEVMQQLGLSNSIVAKFRRTLGIQNNFIYRNDQWLLEHQNELLYDSLDTLKGKYGLNRNQVYQHKMWLAELIKIPTRRKIRTTESVLSQEQWFIDNRSKMQHMTVNEIREAYNVSPYLATKTFNRLRQELGELSYSEEFNKNKQVKYQWLLEHQEELLNSGKSVADLAVQFQKTEGQILRSRAKLRKILNVPKVKDQNETWLLENKEILLDPQLSIEQLSLKFNLRPNQIYRKKGQLGKLLNIPHHKDVVQVWRLDNQEILLSLHLSIPEIAKALDRKENYIVKNRMILRKHLGITVKDQKKAWVLDHYQDIKNLSIEKLQQKYNIGHSVAQYYKKLLITLKQKDN